MKLIPRSFRANVVVVTALATLIAAAAMGISLYTTQKRRSISNLEKLLKLSASESAERVSRWLEDRRESTAGIAASTTLVEELRRMRNLKLHDDAYFLSLYRLKRELDQSTLSQKFIHEITIHDPESGAILLASTGADVETPSSATDGRGVSEAQKRIWVSPMFASTIPLPTGTGQSKREVPFMFIAAPICDGDELYGVLRVRTDVLDIGDNLLRPATYSDLLGKSDTYVVNMQGVVVSPSNFEQELKAEGRIRERTMLELELRAPGEEQFTSAFEQSRALFEPQVDGRIMDLSGYRGVRGRKVVGAWARVANAGWVCVAEIDYDEAFAPLSQLKRTTLLISLVVGVLVVGLTSWLTSRIVAPLKYVADVAGKLASGDRSVRCQLDREDEIGCLATAFDELADAVDDSLTDLEQNSARLTESNQQLESELAERARIEQQLRNANSFLDSVIDNIPTMLFMKDAKDLRFVRFNKAGEVLVGRPREELIGKTDLDLYERHEAESFAKLDRQVLNGREMVEVEEEQLLTVHGLRILHTKKIPIFDENGKPQLLLGISEDITDMKAAVEALKAAKESAESANRAKSDFLANMSHEIRTPMNAIIGMTDLVLDTGLNPTQRDYLSIVAESAESLMSIINQILDFSKIEAGKLELESIDFNVREEIGDTLKSLGIRAHAKELELAWQVDSDVPEWLNGDPIRLRQVLVNLIGNAIKFTEQGEILVTVDRRPSESSRITLHIKVCDTGVGVPREKRERIFSAFEQADASTTREFGGTGLGLAITSSIAKAMGGRVWLESGAGQGSTFHFTGCFDKGAEHEEAEDLPNLSGLPVLVVDDNSTNRRILREMLENWGMNVETVAGGEQAIEVLQDGFAQQPKLPLVISDMQMPGMDGFMLTERLRSMPALREIALIILTSGGRVGDGQRCAELGIVAHLMKPVKPSELLQAIVVAVRGNAARTAGRSQEETPLQSLPPLRILLAEDGKANQIVAVGLLTKWGHTVEVAENGEEAVSLWRRGSFDVILMDVQMPIVDGLDATRRIRELETGRRIPIIAMTARAMKGDRERCLASGMDDYVSKPVRKLELYTAMRRLTVE